MSEKNWFESMDAEVWAKEFAKLNKTPDLDTMRAWFANAIMAGYDEARRRYDPELKATLAEIGIAEPRT